MFPRNKELGRLNFLFTILFAQAALCALILFDVSMARQIVGFLYFTIIPGYIIVKLLKLHLEPLETLIFSVGFSIAFLILVGLALNELSFIAGISHPLSTFPLLIIINMFILIGGASICLSDKAFKFSGYFSLGLIGRFIPFLLPLVFSVVGAMLVGVCGNNLLLLVMILAISLIVAFLALKRKFLSSVYVVALFSISTSLLYHSLLISKYLTTFGSDVMAEYFVFKNTLENGYWSSIAPASWYLTLERLNNMLSITILPSAYSKLLNLDAQWVFKLVFPLIFAFVPLCLFQLWKRSFGEKRAFASAFFFIATSSFYTELLGLNRQMIAELFFVLLLFVLLDNRIERFQKFFSFSLFSFGLIVSHYGLAEIFLFLMVLVLMCLFMLKRRGNNLTVMVILFFVMMFAWYVHTSNASVFESFLEYGEYVYRQLGDFFNPKSRGEMVLRGLGLENPPTVWNAIGRAFAYMTEFLIVVGFVGFILNRKEVNIELEHFILISGAMSLLAALIIIPGLANTLNMTRFYHVLLFFLAPLCVFGADFLMKIIVKNKKKEVYTFILLTIVLVPYFLFQTDFVYEVAGGESWSLPLSMHRVSSYRLIDVLGYIPEQDVIGAYWLSDHTCSNQQRIYADEKSIRYQLKAYGLISPNRVAILYNTTVINESCIVYLRKLNVENRIINSGSIIWNISDTSSMLNDLTKIYSNGGCEMFKK